MQKRVHILSTVNAGAVSKAGDRYWIRGVCGAVDGIVMNGMLYEGGELASGIATLEGKPAPAGHPKNAAGQYISATNGDALISAYAGAICRNARHQGGRSLVDIEVNERQARAHADGARLCDRLDAALNGKNLDPIHVSTGLLCQPIEANGESGGKQYTRKATAINYDHLAFLLDAPGAGTPAEGVGMWLNAEGAPEPIEAATLNTEPADKRATGLRRWVSRLLGNGDGDLSFEAISDGLYKALPEGAWLREVFDRYAVWTAADGKLYRQDYAVASDGSVAWSGTAIEVRLKREYEDVSNHLKEDPMKELILAALNKAGIAVAGKTDDQLMQDYDALRAQPLQTALNEANGKLATFEQHARKAEDDEATAIANELAAASKVLTAADFKAMGLPRLRELKANASQIAAPVLAGRSTAADAAGLGEFKGYSLNSFLEDGKKAA